MQLPRPRWAEMTALDFATDTDGWVAVVPAAAVEQHGPHLPLGTDAIIAEGMVAEAIARLPAELPATFLPVQPFGKSNEHSAWRGTVTLSWETAVKAFLEIATSVARAGIRRIVFVTSHGGNTEVLGIVAREVRVRFDMLAVSTAWFRFGVPDVVDPPGFGIHGGADETALIRHFRPDLVRDEHVEAFGSVEAALAAERTHLRATGPHAFAWKAGDLTPHGVTGDATKGTAARGAAIAAHQADGFVALLADVAAVDLSLLK